MKKKYLQFPQTSLALAALGFFIVLLFWGCNEAESLNPLYDAAFSNASVPEIVSISPADSAFAGVDELTIIGHNFSTKAEDIKVYFNGLSAEIKSIDTNRIVLKAPNLPLDSIRVKIYKAGLDKFSAIQLYKLIPAFVIYQQFKINDTPYALTFDKDGNIYVSLTVNKAGVGIKKILPDGSVVDFAPKGAETFWSCLKFGKSGDLYAARSVKGIFKIAEGATSAVWVSSSNGIGSVTDFDFDQNGVMWAGGNNTSVYSITQAKGVKAFPFTGTVRTVRVFNNYLYVGGLSGGTEGVWRFAITDSSNLGASELYFDYQTAYPSGTIQGITFSADGDLVIGTDGSEPLIIVKPDKSSRVLFPGVLNTLGKSKFNSIFWGSGPHLYYVRQAIDLTDAASPAEAILKVNTKNSLGGAPNYGLQ